MNMTCEEHRSAVVLTLAGECTFEDVDSMRRLVQPFLDRPGLALVVDGCSLERIDSKGLESLLQLSGPSAADSVSPVSPGTPAWRSPSLALIDVSSFEIRSRRPRVPFRLERPHEAATTNNRNGHRSHAHRDDADPEGRHR